MRPLYLSMSAFGPYGGVQKLDFNELKNRSFFLIHGPTGSGKTTILDAICFALYGDTSGSRDSKSVRSDHAEIATATEVEFKFSVGAAVYRVERSPEQERPKKRGEGTTIKAAEAMLWTIEGQDEPKLVTVGWSEVTRKVETILGFKSSQFRQVVLLPQGDFRKLLTANSAERQEIMQTLFKTDLYRNIEETLKTKAQDLKKNFEELNREKSWIQAEAEVTSTLELEEKLSANRVKLREVKEELTVLSELLKKAQQAVSKGLMTQAKLNERDSSQKELDQLNEKSELVEEKRAELAKAQRALTLIEAESNLKQQVADISALKIAVNEQSKLMEHASIQLSEAEKKLAQELSCESQREQAVREVHRLSELSEKMSAIVQAQKALSAAQHVAKNATDLKAVVSQEFSDLRNSLQQKTQDYHLLLEQAAKLGEYKAEADELSRIITKRQGLEAVQQQFIIAAKKLADSEKTISELEKSYQEAKDRFSKLQEIWNRGQAAVMAASLTSGSACPVCGSCEHPRLANVTELVPSEKELSGQQHVVDKLDKEREKARSYFSQQQTECRTLANRVKDLEQELAEQATAAIESLTAKLEVIKARYAEAVVASQKAADLNKQLSQLNESEKSLAAKLEQLEKDWLKADAELKTAEAVLNERQSAVPQEFHQPAVLAEALRNATELSLRLKQNLEKAQRAVQQGANELAKAQASLVSGQNSLTAAQVRLQSAQENFQVRLIEAGFKDKIEYDSAKKSPDYLIKLEERIKVFDNSRVAAQERLERAKIAAEGLTPPDINALEQQVAQAQEKHNAVLAVQTTWAGLIARQEQWFNKLTAANQKLERVSQQFSVIGRLAEVANGANEYKLTFQRFVLGALLDDVADAANARLKTMSRGRYYLQRTMDRARKNAAGGLDLEVFDNYTGAARGVGTLSGGETFLASLSLALGLADVVQSYAGGIHLDTILVDEGFGTLDPEALDFAIKALIDLQKGGRLVGIISHVPELKERIDARLEVSTTQQGSTACFKVG
ncbi:SMC family ATPase [Dendrosporobacter sp. 1207_IL3150]|uniref:SMC family ATPase n=1 Tax=Dendrosporobacter sp. 1207_IL3150 TaxID=3084054 RepID=UPI002FDA2548